MKSYGIEIAEGSKLSNVVIDFGPTYPVSPDAGEIFYHTLHGFSVFDGNAWKYMVKDDDQRFDDIGKAHSSTHSPNGQDALPTGAAVSLSPSSTNAAGSANSYSKSDHTHTITGFQPESSVLTSIAGLSGTGLVRKNGAGWAVDAATYLTANQNITVTGDATGTGSTSINLTLSNSGVTAGTYTKITVDAKGRATVGATLTSTDIPSLSWSKITSGKPTTLSGYGITDAYTKTQVDTSLASKANVATTLAGYGIVDAAPLTHVSDTSLHLSSTQSTWLNAVTATSTEVNYLSGVTSSVQTQLNAKQASIGYTPLNKAGDSILGSLSFPKDAGVGVKIENGYGWKDLIGDVSPRPGSSAAPTQKNFMSTIRGWAYAANDQFDCTFHVPHDYAPGTDLFVHAHWSHNGTTISGSLKIDLNVTYAKGHQQQVFATPKVLSINPTGLSISTTTQYYHRVDEVQLSTSGGSSTLLDTTQIEVDGIILISGTVSTIPSISGSSSGTNSPFIFTVDLHYQSTGLPTKNKTPNFYA